MKQQIHVSGLEMLSKCGHQFERRYINREKQPPGIAAQVGTAVHASVNVNLTKRMLTGELMDPAEVMDSARDRLVKEWDEFGLLESDEDVIVYGPAKAKSLATDKAVRLASLHRRVFAPGYNPTHLERKWVLDIEGFPFELAGAIDIQESIPKAVPTPDDVDLQVIRDVKTAAKTPSQSVADESTQLTMYALALYKFEGKIPDMVALDYLIDNKTPVAKTFSSERHLDDFQPLMRRVEAATRQIQAGIFQPARESDWWCSEKYCGYHRTCKYVRHPVSVPVGLANQLVESIAGAK